MLPQVTLGVTQIANLSPKGQAGSIPAGSVWCVSDWKEIVLKTISRKRLAGSNPARIAMAPEFVR